MTIPFKYGTIVSGKDFCGRADLLVQIVRYIESSQNIVVLGERRVGKSSLVHEFVRRWKKGRFLYVDLMGVKSVDALCRRILRGVVTFEQGAGWLEKVVRMLSHLRPSISADPITGMPTVSFDASIEMKAGSIPEVLVLVEGLAKKTRLVVVLDEFQDILNVEDMLEALSLLRSRIQFQADIPYIFVGSIRHKMEAVFTDHNSAFFKSAIPLNVGPLDDSEFATFLAKKFASGKRRMIDETLQKVFEISNHIPGDIQQLCQALWEVTSENKEVGLDKLKEALVLIFTREQKSYENYVSLLTNLQQKCLLTIAREGGQNIFSQSFMKAGGFTNPSSVRRAILRMVDINLLYENSGEYRFINPFFRAWLIQQGS